MCGNSSLLRSVPYVGNSSLLRPVQCVGNTSLLRPVQCVAILPCLDQCLDKIFTLTHAFAHANAREGNMSCGHNIFLLQMQQNDVRQVMTNPEALRAIMQIQQGMSQLQNTAPGLLRYRGCLVCCCFCCCALMRVNITLTSCCCALMRVNITLTSL